LALPNGAGDEVKRAGERMRKLVRRLNKEHKKEKTSKRRARRGRGVNKEIVTMSVPTSCTGPTVTTRSPTLGVKRFPQ